MSALMFKTTQPFAYLSALRLFFFFLIFLVLSPQLYGQIMYQIPTNKRVNVGSYGRVGVDWNFENGGSIGRRLNLNNMGSIGGRLEEQDYLEVVPNFNWIPKGVVLKGNLPSLEDKRMKLQIYYSIQD